MVCEWQCEIDPWCRRVLAKHWPFVTRFSDVRDVSASDAKWVDVLCGGFPCQDISDAGERAGIDGDRSAIWSEFGRVIRELRPTIAVVENVTALLIRGMDRVLGDLARIGYDAEWECLPAAAFGAHHLRARTFLCAYPRSIRAQARREPYVFTRRHQPELLFSRLSPSDIRRSTPRIPNWLDRLRGLGNAVCPPVAEWVGRRVIEFLQESHDAN